MASDTGSTEQDMVAWQADENESTLRSPLIPVTHEQTEELENIEDRLLTLADKLTLCNRVLRDLKDLRNVVMKLDLRGVPVPTQKP